MVSNHFKGAGGALGCLLTERIEECGRNALRFKGDERLVRFWKGAEREFRRRLGALTVAEAEADVWRA